MDNATDHAARIAEIDQGLLIGNIRPEQARYLLDRVSELEAEIRERRAGQQSMTQRRHELEADLAAALARAEKAESERDALRAEVARLGPVEYEVNNGEGYRACTVHAYQHLAENPQALWTRRAIRVVQPQEGDRHE